MRAALFIPNPPGAETIYEVVGVIDDVADDTMIMLHENRWFARESTYGNCVMFIACPAPVAAARIRKPRTVRGKSLNSLRADWLEN